MKSLKGLDRAKKEEILKKELIKRFPKLANKTIKLPCLSPDRFAHKKKYIGGYLPTAKHRMTPMMTTFFILNIEMIEELWKYGNASGYDTDGEMGCGSLTYEYYWVDPDYHT